MHFKPYPEYKDSGIEWLGKVPSHWAEGRLKNLITLYSGSDYKSHTATPEDESQYPVYGSGGIFTYTSKFIYSGESILLGRKGTLDKPLYVTGSFWTVDTMFYSQVMHRTHGKFVYYHSLLVPFGLYSSNTAIPSMKGSDLSNTAVVIPPPNVQADIASFLDKETSKIDLLISKQQKLIELLEELRKSIISYAVTKGLDPNAPMKDSGVEWLGEVPAHWDIAPLKRLARIQTGNTPATDNASYYSQDSTGVPWVKPEDLNGFTSITKTAKYLTEDGAKIGRRIEKGSILVCCIASIGKMGLAGVEVATNQQINAITYKKAMNSNYGMYIISSASTEHERLANGNVVRILNSEKQGSINLCVPPVKEQAQIAYYLNQEISKIDTAIDKQKQLIDKLKEYRSSIISHAVTGKIDVRELAT